MAVRLEQDELDGGWVAEYLDFPGCVSEGETREEALSNLIEAVREVAATRIGVAADAQRHTFTRDIGIKS